MAYIGAEPVPGQNREIDDISSGFNGSTTAFTLQVSSTNVSPETANNILVNLGGVMQNPGTDYTIAASTITFTTAPASGLSFWALILGAGINTATVADDTIGASKLIDTAVTAGSYTTADITVDAQGRVTAAASGTIANAEIADGAVNNAKVNASAAIAGTKISPDFGSQNITTSGTITSTGNRMIITGTDPALVLTDNQSNPDYELRNQNSVFRIHDVQADTSRLVVNTDGHIDIAGNCDFGAGIDVTGNLDVTGDVSIADTIVHTGDTNTKIRFPAADTFSVETGGSERLSLGATTVFNEVGADVDFRIESDSKASMFFVDAGNNRIGINTAVPANIFEIQDSSTSGDGITEVLKLNGAANNNNDGVKLTFARVNGESCSITAQKVNDNNTTDLIFKTRSSNTVGESMRITGAGKIDLGATGPSSRIDPTSNGELYLEADPNNNYGSSNIRFHVDNTEVGRMVAGTHKFFGLGRTASQSNARMDINNESNQDVIFLTQNTNNQTTRNMVMLHTGASGGFAPQIVFMDNVGGIRGTIKNNTSSTQYNTSSDYRLKENEVVISDGIERIKQLKPYRFNWKNRPDTIVDGFFAHEVQDIVEDCVDGKKDEVHTDNDDDLKIKAGDPKYQQMDHSKLVPLLTAALKEAITEIENLKTKVAALEAA